MKIIDKETIELSEVESILYLIGMGLTDGSEFETKAWRERGCFKSNDGSHKKHIGNLKCCADEVAIQGKGKKRQYKLINFYSSPTDKITGNVNNGYKETTDERVMRAIIYNHLIKHHTKIEEFEHGLSHSGWATFLGIRSIEETESFELQAAEYLQSTHMRSFNEWFKPTEIVNEFQKAFSTIRKGAITNAFDKLQKEEKITTQSIYIAGVPSDEKSRENIVFKVISEEQFIQMKKTREQILAAHGSDLSEYFSHIKKRKNERILRIFKTVEDGLMEEYGATRFHESIKVKVVIIEEQSAIDLFDSINVSFMRHFFERSVTYRHNRDSYKSSTYFWRRFYLLNTCYLLEFIDEDSCIDQDMYSQLKKDYNDNLKAYLYDFDTQFYYPREIKNESFFGNIAAEAEKRHAARMASLEIKVVEDVESLFPIEKKEIKIDKENDVDHSLKNEDGLYNLGKLTEDKEKEFVQFKNTIEQPFGWQLEEKKEEVKPMTRSKVVVTEVEPNQNERESKLIDMSEIINQPSGLQGFGYWLGESEVVKISNKRIDRKAERMTRIKKNKQPRELVDISAL